MYHVFTYSCIKMRQSLLHKEAGINEICDAALTLSGELYNSMWRLMSHSCFK